MALSKSGVALQALGKLDKVVASYHKAITIKPDHENANYNLGSVLYDKGLIEDAMHCYEKALHYNPDFSEAQLALPPKPDPVSMLVSGSLTGGHNGQEEEVYSRGNYRQAA